MLRLVDDVGALEAAFRFTESLRLELRVARGMQAPTSNHCMSISLAGQLSDSAWSELRASDESRDKSSQCFLIA